MNIPLNKEDMVVYQVYIRSFFDHNNDGIGDIPGVTAKLDYLNKLGINMIWLSPFCDSPNDDNGYDISDYLAIMPELGTMEDLEYLIQEAHKRRIGIMMDLVLNHTSDEHPWFMESRKSKDNPYREYYIWEKKPNNWDSYFSPEAWEYDQKTEEYYLHIFSRKQPDLNWKNPVVREELYKIIRFWLGKGIDGFRFDAIHLIGKPEGNPDYIPSPDEQISHLHFRNTEEGFRYLKELNENAFAGYSPITVGETGGATTETALRYTRQDKKVLDMIFHFGFLEDNEAEANADSFRKYFEKWYKALHKKGWDASFLNNHDLARSVSILGDDKKYPEKSATCLALMTLTQFGTPFLYQGEEIGMINSGFKSIEDLRDPHTIIRYESAEKNGENKEEVLKNIIQYGRDNSRTPMAWDATETGGFSQSEPWIKDCGNYKTINVEKQEDNPSSVLNFYRKIISLRKSEESLKRGSLDFQDIKDTDLLIYTRKAETSALKIVLNLSSQEKRIEKAHLQGALILTNYTEMRENRLMPWEARLYRIEG